MGRTCGWGASSLTYRHTDKNLFHFFSPLLVAWHTFFSDLALRGMIGEDGTHDKHSGKGHGWEKENEGKGGKALGIA